LRSAWPWLSVLSLSQGATFVGLTREELSGWRVTPGRRTVTAVNVRTISFPAVLGGSVEIFLNLQWPPPPPSQPAQPPGSASKGPTCAAQTREELPGWRVTPGRRTVTAVSVRTTWCRAVLRGSVEIFPNPPPPLGQPAPPPGWEVEGEGSCSRDTPEVSQ